MLNRRLSLPQWNAAMPRLGPVTRKNAISRLQAEVARHLNVDQSTISRLWQRLNQTWSAQERPRSGRPRIKIGISECSIYVFEQSLLQPLLLVSPVYREFPPRQSITCLPTRNSTKKTLCWTSFGPGTQTCTSCKWSVHYCTSLALLLYMYVVNLCDSIALIGEANI